MAIKIAESVSESVVCLASRLRTSGKYGRRAIRKHATNTIIFNGAVLNQIQKNTAQWLVEASLFMAAVAGRGKFIITRGR